MLPAHSELKASIWLWDKAKTGSLGASVTACISSHSGRRLPHHIEAAQSKPTTNPWSFFLDYLFYLSLIPLLHKEVSSPPQHLSGLWDEGEESDNTPTSTEPEIRTCGFWLYLSILILWCAVFMIWALLALLPLGFALPFLALPTAGLPFPSAEGLETIEELGFPGFKVSLNAAMLALGHVAVPLSTSHDTAGTEHPQPSVNISSNLGWDRSQKDI